MSLLPPDKRNELEIAAIQVDKLWCSMDTIIYTVIILYK